MKKILSFIILAVLLVVPSTMLIGCSKTSDNASNVVNNVYYLESYYEDRVNLTETKFNDRPLKIIFADKNVKVEIGNESEEGHGSFLGSFTTEGSTVKITVDQTSLTGYFAEGNVFQYFNFTNLTYKSGKLTTSFISNSKILQYTFAKAK